MKSKAKARRVAKAKAAKAAKAAIAAEEEARQSAEADREEQEHPQLEEEEEDDDDDDDDDDVNAQNLEKIEPTITIDEATGETFLTYTLAVVNGRVTSLKNDPEKKRKAVAEQRLQMNEVREGIAEKCDHGCDFSGELICREFMIAFRAGCKGSYDAGERDLGTMCVCDEFKAGVDATSVKYAEVWTDVKRMTWIVSFCLSRGTRNILEGNNRNDAFIYASFASYFAQHIATYLLKTQAAIDWSKIEALLDCDDLTLLRFIQSRIPCSCLDEKYEQAKPSQFEEEEEKPGEITWNDPAIHQALKSVFMKRNKMKVVELTFETDQLSHYALPDCYVPHMQIEGPKRRECVHKELSQRPPTLPEWELHWDKMKKFIVKFRSEYNAAGGVLNHNIRAAYSAMKEEYADVWNSTIIMEWASFYFLNAGTQYVLEGNNKAASHYASLAYCFEQHIACNLDRERRSMNWPKLNELYFDPDDHTLVSFFKKRVSCSCLDTKYQEVKSVKKLGICYNFNCPHPDRKVERSLTKCCSQCHRVNYCSRECQSDNWKLHRVYCYGYLQRDSRVDISDLKANTSLICAETSA